MVFFRLVEVAPVVAFLVTNLLSSFSMKKRNKRKQKLPIITVNNWILYVPLEMSWFYANLCQGGIWDFYVNGIN